MRRLLASILAATLTASMMTAPAFADDIVDPHDVLVEVGGDGQKAACGESGAIAGAGADGITVRRGPSDDYGYVDQLKDGTSVYICETRGGWLAVVYGDGECGVSDPIPTRQTYNGPCLSGWLPADRVKVTAG
ncbi:integron [Acuticoccus sp. M5D2P5]|uniref:integron n=1 Tax=Acuticoccus kalidii TaxID=2910977 RepID=UPI001F27216F|nr:integron [Acuticoccus kalidii]MCF3935108.1 integron [Acuticoccus kalidii]